MMSFTTSVVLLVAVITSRDSFTGSASVPETDSRVRRLQPDGCDGSGLATILITSTQFSSVFMQITISYSSQTDNLSLRR